VDSVELGGVLREPAAFEKDLVVAGPTWTRVRRCVDKLRFLLSEQVLRRRNS